MAIYTRIIKIWRFIVLIQIDSYYTVTKNIVVPTYQVYKRRKAKTKKKTWIVSVQSRSHTIITMSSKKSRSSLHLRKMWKVIFYWAIFSTVEIYMTITNILKTKFLEWYWTYLLETYRRQKFSPLKFYEESYILQKFKIRSKETIMKKHQIFQHLCSTKEPLQVNY